MAQIVLALEGLPGGGKTTLAKWIAAEYDFVYLPENLFSGDAFLASHLLKPLSCNEEIYMRNEQFKSSLGVLALERGKNTVMDRCFISTLAINSSLAKLELQNNLHGVRKWIHNSIISGNLRYPDVVCYLRVSPEDSLARKNKIYSLSDVWSSLAGVTFGYSFYETFFAEDHFFRAHIINANGELADVKRSLHGVIKNF